MLQLQRDLGVFLRQAALLERVSKFVGLANPQQEPGLRDQRLRFQTRVAAQQQRSAVTSSRCWALRCRATRG